MRGADLRVFSKLRQREVAPTGMMVALSLVDGELGMDLEKVALDIILNTDLVAQMLEISGEVTLLVNICRSAVKRERAALSISRKVTVYMSSPSV